MRPAERQRAPRKKKKHGKRLLLMKEMLQDLGYPDKMLVDEICQGFKLSGWLPKSNVFPSSLKRPARSMDAVRNMAKGLNRNITKQVASSHYEALAAEVWEHTKEELDKGWAWLDEGCDLGDPMAQLVWRWSCQR